MNSFVLDASLALEWFTVGARPETLAKRSLFDDRVAIVPHLWRFEVVNVLTSWQRRGDVTTADCSITLQDIMQLPFAIAEEGDPEMVIATALMHNLSAYDATYLRLAVVSGAPIATLDSALIKAARKTGVTCL